MNEIINLKGTVESVIFQNSENGYSVFTLRTDGDNDETMTCIAYLSALQQGECLSVEGTYVTHPIYGRQLNVSHYEKSMPSSLDGIEKYLSSGVIKGVGEKLAKKIVTEFGVDTLSVINEMPHKLADIKGITLEKALAIGEIFREHEELRRVMIYLQEFGISPVYAIKIYKTYKEATIERVKTNPYALADEVWGIGFKIADSIAYRVGIQPESPFRIKAGIKYVLSCASANGHVYLPKDQLLDEASDLLGVSRETAENNLIEMQMQKDIWQENNLNGARVYLSYFYYAESYGAKKLIELSRHTLDENCLPDIEKTEKDLGIQLADGQRIAVMEALRCGVLVITGGPGTGKTTAIKTIIKLLLAQGLALELCAPTGRAAKRITEATGMDAKTIHRLLGIKFASDDSKSQTFEKNEDNPLECDVVIVDEASMIDILLMNNLLKAINQGTRLILLGDVDQLPSVGPGNVLKDIIQSNCIKTVLLTEIFRQAQESAIVTNAHKINRGIYPDLKNNKDFFYMRRQMSEDVSNTIVELVTARLPAYAGYDPVRDIQVLTPMRKSPIGVGELNKLMQTVLNPPQHGKREKEFRQTIFREGDKVMQIKNNYNITWRVYDAKRNTVEEGLGIFNGDEGIIKRITQESENMIVVFDEVKEVVYDYSQLEELELSYAVTIHKSQGSEYKAVILPLHSGPPMLMNRNLLYTAVTRAKELVVIVGLSDTVNRMVDNNQEINRYSSLGDRIKKMNDFII